MKIVSYEVFNDHVSLYNHFYFVFMSLGLGVVIEGFYVVEELGDIREITFNIRGNQFSVLLKQLRVFRVNDGVVAYVAHYYFNKIYINCHGIYFGGY